jgi:hypothetical protein
MRLRKVYLEPNVCSYTEECLLVITSTKIEGHEKAYEVHDNIYIMTTCLEYKEQLYTVLTDHENCDIAK